MLRESLNNVPVVGKFYLAKCVIDIHKNTLKNNTYRTWFSMTFDLGDINWKMDISARVYNNVKTSTINKITLKNKVSGKTYVETTDVTDFIINAIGDKYEFNEYNKKEIERAIVNSTEPAICSAEDAYEHAKKIGSKIDNYTLTIEKLICDYVYAYIDKYIAYKKYYA